MDMKIAGIGIVELALALGSWVVSLALLSFIAKWAARGGVREAPGSGDTRSEGNAARGILDERRARGGISREEYGRMRRDIGG
jgi:uncharacterized membrane protein